MSDRYKVVICSLHSLGDADALQNAVNRCPRNYELHSVVPFHSTMHGTTGAYVIFKPIDFRETG